MDSAEVFDKMSKSWVEAEPMNVSRANASSLVHNGNVLVAGGVSDDDHVVSSIEQFRRSASAFVPPYWSDLFVNLPRPLQGHRTMID
jgi:hypothetical protein